MSMNSSSRRSLLLAASGVLSLAAQELHERDWSTNAPVRYPDPDVVTLEKSFSKYKLVSAQIERVCSGFRWAEGPAWNGAGNYLVWSDIPNDRQMRWLEEDGHVSAFRKPSNYSNGNTFDYQARQISCEHQARRVVRFEQTGAVTVLADHYEGKQLNAPNDVVVHPDGDIWFTDPGYGGMSIYEGGKFALEIKEAVYRIDGKSGQLSKVTDDQAKPNGLCFSPDFRKLYICDTGAQPGSKEHRDIRIYDVDGPRLKNGKQFLQTFWDDYLGVADGIRCDMDGNIWAGIGQGGPVGDGVYTITPEGQKIGRIKLPEICANICFGGTRRNRLFMAASESLYSLFVDVKGASIA